MIQDAEIRKIGYARVSTEEQELSLQLDAIHRTICLGYVFLVGSGQNDLLIQTLGKQ